MQLRFVVLVVCLLVSGSSRAAEIRWEPFPLKDAPNGLRAQLGRMTVPLVRSDAASGTAEIVFVRLQAGEGKPATPIVYLPGGPGGSGVSATRSGDFLRGFAAIAEMGDVILLDPRGVGRSTPRAVCPAARPLEPAEKFADPAQFLPLMIAAASSCVEEWRARGVDVRAFTNRESAQDIDDLREGLGVSKIRLFGFSYGTHLALSVLHYHPAAVDRMILLGTEGPDHTRKLPFTLDAQLAKLSLLSGSDMHATLARVLERIAKEPVVVNVFDRSRKSEVAVPIGRAGLQRLLVQDIGDGNDFVVFPALLKALDQGDSSILKWFVDKRYNQISGSINLMILGMECSSGATANRQREIERQANVSLFGNAMNFPFPGICTALPPVDLGAEFRRPLPSAVPVLFVSGTLDSNTPPFQAEEVRWGMPHSAHLIVENAGHEDTLPMPEVQRAMADFLSGKDVRSRTIALPAREFLTIDAAKKDRSVD